MREDTEMAMHDGTIDRSSPIPLYRQLEDSIRRDIERGTYGVGELLPSESEICARYDLSRSVVRQTLQNLAQAGIVRTERGRGSFVAEKKLSERFVQRTTGFYDDLTRMGLRIDTRVLRQEIASVPSAAREFLDLEEAVRIDRVRSVEGRVLAYVRTYISPERCPGLERFDLANTSLYGLLREVYGLEVYGGWRTVEAVPADDEVAEHLEVEPGTPLLLLCSASRTEDGAPLEWFAAWHRADRTRFEVEILPDSGVRPFTQTVIPTATAPTPGVGRDRAGEAVTAVDRTEPGEFGRRLAAERVVAVVRAPRYADGAGIAGALAAGGIGIVEFTLTGANALDAIAQARAGAPEALVGAGSVLSVDDARRAVEAGAQFLVSPAGVAEVATAGFGVPVVLAGYTPTEILNAHRLTGGPVKLFPAVVGGATYLKAVAAPMPHIPLMPSGGVDERNLGEFLAAGAVGVNLGSSLCPVPALVEGDVGELRRRAAAARRAVEDAVADGASRGRR